MCYSDGQPDDGGPMMKIGPDARNLLSPKGATKERGRATAGAAGLLQRCRLSRHRTEMRAGPFHRAAATLEEATGSAQDNSSTCGRNSPVNIPRRHHLFKCTLQSPDILNPYPRLGHTRSGIRRSCRDPARSSHLTRPSALLILNQGNHFGTLGIRTG